MPLIQRSCGRSFLSVRMVGKVLLAKFIGLPNEVLTCATVFSFRVTEAEIKLLSDVPYTHKDGVKYLLSLYFEGEIDYAKRWSLTGWDCAYLRFCCKEQGVKDELIVGDRCEAVPLQELRLYFAPGTNFMEYWPSKDLSVGSRAKNRHDRAGPRL